MTPRRVVRCAPSFFERLDQQLPATRGATGVPSSTDFLVHELPAFVDLLANHYEFVTQPLPGLPGVRALIATGDLVALIALHTVLTGDDAVEIISVELDDEAELAGLAPHRGPARVVERAA